MTDKNRKFTYPATRKEDVVEDYHGTPVADPYRWLENAEDEEVIAWSEAQATMAFDYLEELPARAMIKARLTALWDYPKYTTPISRKEQNLYFFSKNDGLQNQPLFYRQEGLDGKPEPILDPNKFSEDGTVALINTAYSKDGTLLAYTTASGGSDWQEIRIKNLVTGEHYDEVLNWCKFTNIAWKPDNSGFYYSRMPEPADDIDSAETTFHNKVYWHQLGTPQSDDLLIYERPDQKTFMFSPFLTRDEQYLVFDIFHAAINRNRLYYRPIDSDGDFVRLLDEADAEYRFMGSVGSTFYIRSDLNAPNGRIIAIDLNNPERENWQEIIPENDTDAIDFAVIVNHQIVIAYKHNAYHQLKIYALDGTYLRDIDLPTIGSIVGMSGREYSTEMFISFESYLYPPTIFRYDFDTNELSTWQETKVDFEPSAYETKQVFYESKDGTKVSMFLTHKKGLELDGNNHTLLYGYGGYSISLMPSFAPERLQWIEGGGIYVVVNLRGGSEYGEAWHQAGMLENKQNVFDDFITAAEWLIENKYTQTAKLAIMGRSNGGLLVSACMIQRPELFGAVICGVPVTDMLRYHKFTAGRYWTAEYGNAIENPEHFEFLIKYSPVHNIKPDVDYPPTLVVTADMDDRVVPMHAKKFTAGLQDADLGEHPILLRLDTRSGHGLGKPTSKWITEWADIYAFLYEALNVT